MMDNRLQDGMPMLPVRCHSCAAEVLVRKSSFQQTSIQWDAGAVHACPQRDPAGPGRAAGCPALRESIDEQVESGALPLAQEVPPQHEEPVRGLD